MIQVKHSNCFAANTRSSDFYIFPYRLLRSFLEDESLLEDLNDHGEDPPSKGADGTTIDRTERIFLHIFANLCFFFCFFPGPRQTRIAADLIELRNKSVFAFFMFNALFVLIVFLLQLNKDQLHVVWPLGVKTNITFIEETSEVSGSVLNEKQRCCLTDASGD